MPKLLVKSSQCASRLRSKWHFSRPIGRNFIQIIIWISLCSVTASPCQFERLSCQFERSREHVRMYTSQWHLASHLDYARCDTLPCQFERSRCQFERSREHVAMTSGLASRADRRPLLSMWHTSSGTPPEPIGRNFIQIIIWILLCSMWHPIVSSSTSSFDLLKSNEEATVGPGGVPLKNTLFKVRNQLICSISISSEILRIWIISTLWKLL
jgi:hypothetical protein